MAVFCCYALIWIASSLGTSWSNPLSGKHFRVAYRENPLAIYETYDDRNETVVRGLFPDMLEVMAARGNFTYTFVLLTDYKGYQSLPAQLEKYDIDWCTVMFAAIYPRNKFTLPLFPHWQISNGIIIPYPKRQANLWSVVLPYTATVWLCFLASMVVTGVLLGMLARAKRRIHGYTYRDAFQTFEGSVLYVIGVAANQGASCFSKARSVRLLAGVWCLAAFVIVNAYSSSLITYMTAPRITPLVNSIRDLDNKSEPQILTRNSTQIGKTFEENPRYRFIRDNYLRVPGNFCGDIAVLEMDNCLELVKQGTHVIVLGEALGTFLIDADFKKSGRCDLTMAEDYFESLVAGWVMPLNSPHWLRNAIDVLTMEIVSHGLLEYWDRFYEAQNDFCLKYKTVDRSLRKLSLKDFASAFIVLGVGLTLSCVVFIYELVIGKKLGCPSIKKRSSRPESVTIAAPSPMKERADT